LYLCKSNDALNVVDTFPLLAWLVGFDEDAPPVKVDECADYLG